MAILEFELFKSLAEQIVPQATVLTQTLDELYNISDLNRIEYGSGNPFLKSRTLRANPGKLPFVKEIPFPESTYLKSNFFLGKDLVGLNVGVEFVNPVVIWEWAEDSKNPVETSTNSLDVIMFETGDYSLLSVFLKELNPNRRNSENRNLDRWDTGIRTFSTQLIFDNPNITASISALSNRLRTSVTSLSIKEGFGIGRNPILPSLLG